MSLLAKTASILKGWGGRPFVISVRFTTNGSGVPTLAESYGGSVTIAQSTNSYTLTFKPWTKTTGVFNRHSTARTVTTSDSPTAGTVTIAFSDTFYSATCDVLLCCLASPH